MAHSYTNLLYHIVYGTRERQPIIDEASGWQVGYAAFTVSESQADRVRHYIQTQAEHHRKAAFEEELAVP